MQIDCQFYAQCMEHIQESIHCMKEAFQYMKFAYEKEENYFILNLRVAAIIKFVFVKRVAFLVKD